MPEPQMLYNIGDRLDLAWPNVGFILKTAEAGDRVILYHPDDLPDTAKYIFKMPTEVDEVAAVFWAHL